MSLFTFRPSPGPRWPVATQAALAIGIPIAVMTLLGNTPLGLAASAGAFTLLYSGSEPTKARAKTLPFVAAGLIVAATFGAFTGGAYGWFAIGVVAVAILAATLSYGFRLGPPGPVFFVLVFGLAGYVTGSSSVQPIEFILAFVAGCVLSYLIALSPLLLPPARRRQVSPLGTMHPGPAWDADARLLLIRVTIVAVLGALIGYFIDPDRAYWIVGAGIAVIGIAANRRAAFERGLHRALGTVLGAGVYALLALLHPNGLWLAVLLASLQFIIEFIVVRNYALALVFITPLVLTLTAAATGGAGGMEVAMERIIDTLIGSALGAASGLLHPRSTRG